VGWGSLDASIEGLERSAALEGAMRSLLVVTVAKEVGWTAKTDFLS
jgi:hypothetical protein